MGAVLGLEQVSAGSDTLPASRAAAFFYYGRSMRSASRLRWAPCARMHPAAARLAACYACGWATTCMLCLCPCVMVPSMAALCLPRLLSDPAGRAACEQTTS